MYGWVRSVTSSPLLQGAVLPALRRLPRSLVLGLAAAAGVGIYAFAGSVRKRSLRNMADLLQDRYTPEELRERGVSYFVNLAVTLAEILCYAGTLEQEIDQVIEPEGEAHLQAALAEGRGAILLSTHTGNIFYYYYYLSRRYPCLTVATASSEDLRELYLIFHRLGCQGLDYDGTSKLTLARTLGQHLRRNGVVVLFGDFWRPHFPLARFFSRWTRRPLGAAALAMSGQVPVVPFYGFRREGTKHTLVFHPPIRLHEMFRPGEQEQAAQYLDGCLERVISALPEHWFYWFQLHQRWEAPPAGANLERRVGSP